MMAPIVIGADPGKWSGAIVALCGRRVVVWWVYTWLTDRETKPDAYRVRWAVPVPVMSPVASNEVPSMNAVANRVVRWWERQDPRPEVERLCVEGLFVPTWKPDDAKRQQAQITTSHFAGELLGPMRRMYVAEPMRPTANTWRPAVAGIKSNASASKAEACAIRVAEPMFDWPGGGLAGYQITKAERGALAEAALIARYGLVFGRRGTNQQRASNRRAP